MPCLQARAVAEFDGARSHLMALLPAELPGKDVVHGPQPGVAAPEEVVAPLTEDQLVDSLVGLPWDFIINKDARQEWAKMDRPFRSALPRYPWQIDLHKGLPTTTCVAAVIPFQGDVEAISNSHMCMQQSSVSCPMS